MPTLAEIRDSILSQLSGHVPSDDIRIEYGLIDKLVRDKRSLLIKDRMKRGLGVEMAYYQMMDCLRIEHGEIICNGEPSGVHTDYIELPEIASVRGNIAYLGTIDGSISFQQRAYGPFIRADKDRFCTTRPVYTIIGNRAYLRSHPDIRFVRLNAILADPARNRCILDFEDTLYPVPDHVVHQIETLVLRQLISTLPIAPDIKNNAVDDSAPTARINTNTV